LRSAAGLWQLLWRLRLHYKRARDYLHSPDPHYEAKLTWIQERFQQARTAPQRYVFLYLDELTFYRQPTLASAYAAAGSSHPLAYRSHHSNTCARVVAAMNALTGQVTYHQGSRINLPTLRQFYYELRAAYPQAETLYVTQDNWPVHFHPDITVVLAPQTFPWPPNLPANWPQTPRAKVPPDNLPLQLLFLPTYAPWTNPIEKLWRWLKQQLLHLHRLSDNWEALKHMICEFLEQFASGSLDLLRYVGLLPN
jgi:hypothetical protein